MRVFANIVIIVMSIWALAAAATAMLGITFYFPWVLEHSGEIPPHRLAAIRVGVLLTCVYFGFLHVIGKSTQLYPINFLTTFLSFLVVGGTVVFYRYQVVSPCDSLKSAWGKINGVCIQLGRFW